MFLIILQILTISLPVMEEQAPKDVIWEETFSVPEKGVWADSSGSIKSDFTEITTWTLEYADIELTDENDYAKTVSTSGGRFECRDIDGEVVWRSEVIDISESNSVNIQLTAYETGSGPNPETKYLKAFYRLDGGSEIPISICGENRGNWGSVQAEQRDLSGETLQVVCYLANHYANDKVTLDDVIVWKAKEPLPPVNPYDVVINELMADPYPVIGLPRKEFIELHNTQSFAINTENWKLGINGVVKELPTCLIEPDGYLLLCSTGSIEELLPFGNISGVPGFQGLLNKGALIEIWNEKGMVIDRIEYDDQWYSDEEKENGGWSLERIDPHRHCNQKENWKASNHPNGGTPGKVNSIFGENRDTIPPILRWGDAVSENEVELVFSESMDSLTIKNTQNYLLEKQYFPERIIMISNQKIVLRFTQPLKINKTITLKLKNLTDECGNQLKDYEFEIQWNTIEPGDLVINEVLFDPFPGGKDFVEIFNHSEKQISLHRLFLANRTKKGKLNQIYPLTSEKYTFQSKSYLVLTEDTNGVFPWFSINCAGCFLQMEKMPSFPNAEGYVVLLTGNKKIIDEFYYTEKMHSPFLADTEGISLERVSPYTKTNTPGNWYSASTGAGYGTPGYENSQVENEPQMGNPQVLFEPEAFSPNEDGYNDEYTINYRMNKPGYVANIKIFDASGRFILHLAKNEILGITGQFSWNGENETGRLQSLGLYVVLVEIFNSKGEIHRFKDGVVLTDPLE